MKNELLHVVRVASASAFISALILTILFVSQGVQYKIFWVYYTIITGAITAVSFIIQGEGEY